MSGEDATQRARCYALFAELIDAPADPALLRRAKAHPALGEALAHVDEASAADLDRLAARHYLVFDRGAFPWAGVYQQPEARAGGAVGEAVAASLAGLGVEVGADVEAADHLPVLLRALSALCQRQADALAGGDRPAERRSRARQILLLDRHLLSWLPLFVHAASGIDTGFYAALVGEMERRLLQHRVELGDLPVDSLALAGGPGGDSTEAPLGDAERLDLGDPATGLGHIARWLCTPAYSGLFLSIPEIQALARGQSVPHGFGSRWQLLADTLRSGARFEALPQLVAGLQKHVESMQSKLSTGEYGLPLLAPLTAPWLERLATTREVLAQLVLHSDVTSVQRPQPRGPGLALALLGLSFLIGCAPWVEPGEEIIPARGVRPRPAASSGQLPCPEPCELFQIAWTGDTMLGDHGRKVLEREGLDYPLRKVKVLLEGAFAIGNAEGPITTHREKFNKRQMWSYGTSPEVAEVFAGAGFDAMGLANNHAFDRGPIGLEDTLGHLHAAGVQTFGAGMDREQAEAPLLIETPYGKVAVVAMFRTGVQGQESGPGRPGTAWLNEVTLRRTYARARRAGAKWVVAYVHWGRNYQGVRGKQQRLAGQLARAGYDLVVGHGSHSPQEVDIVAGMPVLYSLGNFTFTSHGRFQKLHLPHLGYGLVARGFLGPDGFEGIELGCLKTDNRIVHFQPRLCSTKEVQVVQSLLGDDVTRRGNTLVLAL
jgi:poly-gamma-glutamate synthesis protein (capsule biosynthesis protein)